MKIIVDCRFGQRRRNNFKGVIETNKLLKDLYFVVIRPRRNNRKSREILVMI